MKKITLLIASTLLVISGACANKSESKTVENTSQTENLTTAEATSDSSVVVKTIDNKLKGADILPAITKSFEGKVVLIDFWATWCGPCRMAMKSLDEIKPELQAKGVEFVYVTGETSPLKDWEPMIKNIKGTHYRLSDSQWDDLCNKLGIPGIPSYLLLNKDGSVAFSNLNEGGYPGNEVLQNNIEVALTK